MHNINNTCASEAMQLLRQAVDMLRTGTSNQTGTSSQTGAAAIVNPPVEQQPLTTATSDQQNSTVEEHKRLFNRQSVRPTFHL